MIILIIAVLFIFIFIFLNKILLAKKIVDYIAKDEHEKLDALIKKKPYLIEKQVKKWATPLILASAWGSVNSVRVLLESGANPNFSTHYGTSPLMMAKNEIVASLLLNASANINDVDDLGRTPLIEAIEGGSSRTTINFLLSKGADPRVISKYNSTAMSSAVNYDRPEIVQDLLNFSSTKLLDIDHSRAFQYACRKNFQDLIEICILHGCDVNGRDYTGNTPLICACASDNLEVVKILLKQGADVNLCNKELSTPLMEATKAENKEIVKLLLKYGARINEKDLEGRTSLMYACDTRQVNIVELLLERGANVNIEDNEGKTSILYAMNSLGRICYLAAPDTAILNSRKIIKTLIEYHADVNAVDSKGNTVLRIAIEKCPEENWHSGSFYKIMELFKSTVINLEHRDRLGNTPLFYAIQQDNSAAFCWLISQRANINAQNNKGETPLHFSLKREITFFIHRLLDVGADVYIKNYEGMSFSEVFYDWISAKNMELKEFYEKRIFGKSIPDWYRTMENKHQ